MSNGTTLPSSDEHISQSESTPHHSLESHDSTIQDTIRNTPNTSQPHTNSHGSKTLQETCADIHDRVNQFLTATPSNEIMQRTQEQTQIAISVIQKALQDYDFEALSISYNGGKDCLVLLILYLAVIHTHFTQPSGKRKETTRQQQGAEEEEEGNTTYPSYVQSIYAKPPDPFDSVTEFVESSTRDCCLDLTHISTNPGSRPKDKSHSSPPTAIATTTTTTGQSNGDMRNPPLSSSSVETLPANPVNDDSNSMPIVSFRDAFALYLQTHPKVQAIFVGTRRTDPHGAELQHFQMTDGNWPRFMRIHPVIDWRLCEIWCFLRSDYLADPRTGKRLEYCGMYDAGYTSLGGVGDTLRNPRLRYYDEDGKERYKPAYEMTEDQEERAGRE